MTRSVIIGKFPVKNNPGENFKFWDGKLDRPPHWLKGARTFSGKAGVPSLWNPLLVAHALLGWKAKYIGFKALDKVMRDCFPAQYEQWKEKTETER